MSAVFDGTGGTRYAEEGVPEEPVPVIEVDALTLLKSKVSESEDLEFEPTTVEIPGNVGIRLICSSDIEGNTLTKWQKAALPPNKRNSPKISPLLLDQLIYNTTILIETCTAVQVRNAAGEWNTITDGGGDVLNFKDKALLDVLGVVDPRAAVKKLFRGREASVSRAAQDVLTGAGWGEDGDDGDPR